MICSNESYQEWSIITDLGMICSNANANDQEWSMLTDEMGYKESVDNLLQRQ